MRIRDVMRAHPTTVEPETSVADARRLAESEGARHLVVAIGNRIVGVVEEDGLWLSAEDVLRTAAGLQGSLTAREERSVRSAMRPATPVVSPHESLAAAARVMLLKHRTAIPVVDAGRLVGILTVDQCRQAVGAPLMAVTGPGSGPPESEQEHASASEDTHVA